MAENYDGWQVIEQLGEGGQGRVYKARSPQRVQEIHNALIGITVEIRDIADLPADATLPESLTKWIVDVGKPDPPAALRALKVFKIPEENREQKDKAIGRLQQEVKALMELRHPSVLRLLHAPPMFADEHFIVTEYHPEGTLNKYLHKFVGRPLEALTAFRPLAEAVTAIHEKGAIHRDIKTQNIFVAGDGRLVLGDFGIVFFRDASNTRFTETYERVGSHYWMAPWAYEPKQLALESVTPALDIYPLAKVLWSMIAGRDGFPYWEYNTEENNLERLFPDDLNMPLVNELLAKCIVRHEKDFGLPNAVAFLSEVDALVAKIKSRRGEREDSAATWPCRICGKGKYHPAPPPRGSHHNPILIAQVPGGGGINEGGAFSISVCNHCGHAELFTR